MVKSNHIKDTAYYQLFSSINKDVIVAILSKANTLSRYEIIKKILKKDNQDFNQEVVDSLAKQYGEYVTSAVKNAPSTAAAEALLLSLMPYYSLYLSSLTPKDSLLEIIDYRNLSHYFKKIFGYPSLKTKTLKKIARKENCQPNQILVIGDGESDELSAKEVGCHFFRVSQDEGLEACFAYLGVN